MRNNWTKKMFDSIASEDYSLFEISIQNGADINAHDDTGYSIVATSVFLGRIAVQKVLDAGINPNIQNADGSTAISTVIGRKNAESILKLLVSKGALVDAESEVDGYSSLHLAAESGASTILKILLETQCSKTLDQYDYVQRTPLMCTIESGYFVCAKMLLKSGANINAHNEKRIGDTAINLAAAIGTPGIVRFLLDNNADPNIRTWMQMNAFDQAKQREGEQGNAIRKLLNSSKRFSTG